MTFFRNFVEDFLKRFSGWLGAARVSLNRHMGRLEPSVNSDFQKSFQRFLPLGWKRFRRRPVR
jgi:hypothetical protein